MGIFDKQSEVSKGELRSNFSKDSGRIPGSGGKRFDNSQRSRMEKEIFGERYGSSIDKNEYRRAIMNLESKRNVAKTPEDKSVIKQKIDYLKSVGGWKVR
jgi:hypothetical protein